METRKLVVTTLPQTVPIYESDVQAERFFRDGFTLSTLTRGLEPGETYTKVRELGAYMNPTDGFSTWFLVQDLKDMTLLLVHSSGVRTKEESDMEEKMTVERAVRIARAEVKRMGFIEEMVDVRDGIMCIEGYEQNWLREGTTEAQVTSRVNSEVAFITDTSGT